MIYADAHIHILEISDWTPLSTKDDISEKSPVCACAHSPKEWEHLIKRTQGQRKDIVCSFGIHPQNPAIPFIYDLENILKGGRKSPLFPDALGEAGFDLFTREYASHIDEQKTVWHAQLEFAAQYSLPLVVHCRHALDRIFADSKKLTQIPSVIFHSFPGSPLEALSIIRRGIPARFSLGKPILNGNKRALRCAQELPLELLLAETDAPYQTLKNEVVTKPSDIKTVYEKIANIRTISIDKLCDVLHKNFWDSFTV